MDLDNAALHECSLSRWQNMATKVAEMLQLCLFRAAYACKTLPACPSASICAYQSPAAVSVCRNSFMCFMCFMCFMYSMYMLYTHIHNHSYPQVASWTLLPFAFSATTRTAFVAPTYTYFLKSFFKIPLGMSFSEGAFLAKPLISQICESFESYITSSFIHRWM